MRHGRAKAARKTLQYFKRTIGLTTPYDVLVDGNFVVMCFQQKVVPIRDRIERVLQISSSPSYSTTTTTTSQSAPSSSSRHQPTHQQSYNKKMIQFWITQDTIDELKMILENLNRQLASFSSQPEQEQEHHQKNKKKSKNNSINKSQKVAAFEEALQWINEECQILPKVVAVVDSSSSSSSKVDSSNPTTPPPPPPQSLLPAWTAMVHYIWGNARPENNEEGHHGRAKDNSGGGGPYIVASQDEELLDILRRGDVGNKTLQEMMTQQLLLQQQQQQQEYYEATAVPILRLANNNSVLLLEQPSKQFQRASQSEERQKWTNRDRVLSEHERELVDLVKQQQHQRKKSMGGVGDHGVIAAAAGAGVGPIVDMKKQRKAGKKAKGPNPLSCKRKQHQQQDGGGGGGNKNNNESASKKRRERAKKRQKITS